MNINQNSNTTPINSSTKDKNSSSQQTKQPSELEAFSSELFMAQNKTDWFAHRDIKEEKQRVYEERLKELRDLDSRADEFSEMAFLNHARQKSQADYTFVDEQLDIRKAHLRVPTVEQTPDQNQVKIADLSKVSESGNQTQKGVSLKLSGERAEAFDHMLDLKTDPNKESARLTDLAKSQMEQKLNSIDISKQTRSQDNPVFKAPQSSVEQNRPELSAKQKLTAKIDNNSTLKNSGESQRGQEFKIESFEKANEKSATAKSDQAKANVTVKDVQNNVRFMVSNDKNEMTMRLVPANLGKLEIRLRKEGEKMVGRFKVENKQAKSALEANIQNLKSGLEKQGILIDEFMIFVKDEKIVNADSSYTRTSKQGVKLSSKEETVSLINEDANSSFPSADLNVTI